MFSLKIVIFKLLGLGQWSLFFFLNLLKTTFGSETNGNEMTVVFTTVDAFWGGKPKKTFKKKIKIKNGPISVAEGVNSFGSLVFSKTKFHAEELSWCERLCCGSRGPKRVQRRKSRNRVCLHTAVARVL